MISQIEELRKDIEDFSYTTKQEGQEILNILYSGNNKNILNENVPNPSLHSQTKFYEHNNVGDDRKEIVEELMRISTSETWKSLTYPGEFVQIRNEKICQRMNIPKMLFADFDYRFCPIQKETSTLFETKKHNLELLYGTDYFGENESEIKNFLKDNIYTQLRFVEDCLHLYHLRVPVQWFSVDFSEQNLPKYNIFENCESNVRISNSSVYMNHIPGGMKIENVNIENSENIVLMGNENIDIEDSQNIIMEESTNEGNVRVYKGSYYFLGKNFASNGGDFESINAPSRYFVANDNVLVSGKLEIIDCQQASIILEENSCEFSDIQVLSSFESKILVEKNSVKFSKVLIQKSLMFSYLNVIEDSLCGGNLFMKLHCFNGQVGCVCCINCRQAIFPIGIKYFYYEKFIDSIEMLYGTHTAIENTIAFKGVYQNGPYDDGQIENIVKPEYLVNTLPGNYATKRNWYGYSTPTSPWGEM